MATTVLVCPRCHYETTKKSSLINHLVKKKKPCPTDFSNDDPQTIIDTLNARKFECTLCLRVFSDGKHLSKHDKFCASKNNGIIDALRSNIVQLNDKVHHLEQMAHNAASNTTINNINNINNTFNIVIMNNFGSEDRSYIPDEIIQHCVDNFSVSKLIDCIYFNPDHPENHTIKLKSEKQKRVMLHEGGIWVEEDMNTGIDSMIRRENCSVYNYFHKIVWPDESINFETRAWMQEKFAKITDMANKTKGFYEERRKIQAKLKNHHASISVSPTIGL